MRIYHLLLLLLLFLFFFGSTALPQEQATADTPNPETQYDTDSKRKALDFNDDTIENFKNDKDFDYTEAVAEENWWTRFKKWIGDLWSNFWDWVIDGV
jgi:hypothetical protein